MKRRSHKPLGKSVARAAAMLFAAVLLVYAGLAIRHQVLLERISNYTAASGGSFGAPVMLSGVPVLAQQYGYSCGLATIAMVRSGLGGAVTEQQVTQELGLAGRRKGMLPQEFLQYARKALPGYDVRLVSDRPDSEVLELIYSQLQAGMPVPVYFSTVNAWDRPNYDTHYSVVTGMDPAANSVTIANAYGYTQSVGIGDFLDSMKYKNYRNKPLYFSAAVLAGAIGMNNVYIISGQQR